MKINAIRECICFVFVVHRALRNMLFDRSDAGESFRALSSLCALWICEVRVLQTRFVALPFRQISNASHVQTFSYPADSGNIAFFILLHLWNLFTRFIKSFLLPLNCKGKGLIHLVNKFYNCDIIRTMSQFCGFTVIHQ